MMTFIVVFAAAVLVIFLFRAMKTSSSNKLRQETKSFPNITVRVERTTERRSSPSKVDFTKLTGIELYSYEITGVGETSGRKRKKVVEALNEEGLVRRICG